MTDKERELFTQALKLITELDKEGTVLEMGLILEMREALAQPEQKLNDPPAYVEPPTSDYHNGWEEGFEAAKNLFKKESAPQNADPRLLLARKDNCIALAQPEQEPFKPDWVSYRQGVVDGAAQPEQEEPLPLVDIGVDVTPEGTHVVACYNRPDAVQEMFYSQFHPLTKPEQEPVCDKDPFYCWSIRCQVGKVCKHAAPPRKEWVGLTHDDIENLWNGVQWSISDFVIPFTRAIEAKLKEKNNAV